MKQNGKKLLGETGGLAFQIINDGSGKYFGKLGGPHFAFKEAGKGIVKFSKSGQAQANGKKDNTGTGFSWHG